MIDIVGLSIVISRVLTENPKRQHIWESEYGAEKSRKFMNVKFM